MTKRLAPQQPQWFSEPTNFSLEVEEIVEGPFPEEEVAISFYSNGDLTTAVVPSRFINKEQKSVEALVVGQAGDYFLVALPAGSSGHTIVMVKKSRIQALTS